MPDCSKCRSPMSEGYIYTTDSGGRLAWLDGEPGGWKALAAAFGVGTKPTTMSSRRCSECGFIELYADAKAKPIKTLSTVDEETRQLRSLVAKMQERLAALETIATDPGERIAREIESLRSRPTTNDEEEI